MIGLAAAAPKGTNPSAFPLRAAVVGCAAVLARAPAGLTKDHLSSLAGILRETVSGGTLAEVAVARLGTEAAKPAAGPVAPPGGSTARRRRPAGIRRRIPAQLTGSPEGSRPRGAQPALSALPRTARQGDQVRQPGEGMGRGAGDPGVPRRRSRGEGRGSARARSNSPRGSRTNSGRSGSTRASPRTPTRGMEILATLGGARVARALHEAAPDWTIDSTPSS